MAPIVVLTGISLALFVPFILAQEPADTPAPGQTLPPKLRNRPGQCIGSMNNKDCNKFGPGYQCVAVETSISAARLNQCILGPICTGGQSGTCPVFSNWDAEARKVEPVCAFVRERSCVSIEGGNNNTFDSSSVKLTKNGVKCYVNSMINPATGDVATTVGIYKCIDKKLFSKYNLGNISDFQIKGCAANSSTNSFGESTQTKLCNGHGTCAPKSMFSTEYECKCSSNAYVSSDNCDKPVSNACSGLGECGINGRCDPTNGQCMCQAGSTGSQCASCDPTTNVSCTSRGSCGIDGQCLCNTGFEGDHCEIISKRPLNLTQTNGSSGANIASLNPLPLFVTLCAILPFIV